MTLKYMFAYKSGVGEHLKQKANTLELTHSSVISLLT